MPVKESDRQRLWARWLGTAPLAAAGRRRMVADRYGSGPPVVLLHGQPGSALDWHAVVPLLWDDFTVIVPDRLGYGRTGGPPSGFDDNAGALAALLDSLNVGPVVVGGHSWGGGVALAFAESYASLTAGLVLAAPVGPGERFGWSDRALAAPVLGEALAALTLGAAGRLLANRTVQAVADRHLGARAGEAVRVLTGLTGARPGAAAWRSFVVEQRVLLNQVEELGPRLPRIGVPTMVVTGSADRLVSPHVAERLGATIPGAERVVLPGAHHLLPHDHPEEVAAAVVAVAHRAWPSAAGGPTSADPVDHRAGGRPSPRRTGPGLDGKEAAHRERRPERADDGPHHEQQDPGEDGFVGGDVQLPGAEDRFVADE
jgi:pimeloyl-ACP methyl ester carboxylesterase